MSGLDVSLLGRFYATMDGQIVDSFRTSKVQALLIYLLVRAVKEPGGGVGREKLMTLLWPEMPRKSAQDNLRQTLYHLRRTVPAATGPEGDPIPFILSDRQQVQINADARYRLDVATFTALVEEGRPDQLAAAIELYQGDFLADFYLEDSNEFEGWAAGWRRRLQRQALQALDRLVAGLLQQGQVEEAAAYARRALAIDELRESAHRGLIKALGQMGKRAAALRQYERCRRLLEAELGVKPAAETEALAAEVRRAEQPGRRKTHLPVPANPLIGRDKELADLAALLANQARLVSIVGPGGMGKTHLALELARRLTGGDEGDGAEDTSVLEQALYVDMAPLAEADDLLTAVAGALGLAFNVDDRVEGLKQRVLNALADRNLLLLLDNFEHLLEAAPLLSEILQAAPMVKLLVTTRERLKLRAEHTFPIGGLTYSTWTTPVEASRDPAAQLFLHHARRARPAFSLRSEPLGPLRELVGLTGGMPLALILAAGWVKVLDLAQIVAEIRRSLDFLQATERDVPPRQRSMRAVFGATWGRLNERERGIFPALSVFRGGFTLAAAEEVSGATAHDLLSLADHSLLVRDADGRFAIHELLRQFAAAKLEEERESENVLAAHSAYYLRWLADLLPDLKGRGQLDAVGEIDQEFYNVREAWRRACEKRLWDQFPAASQSVLIYTLIRSRYEEGIALFDRARHASGRRISEVEVIASAYALAGYHDLLEGAGLREEALGVIPDLRALLETIDDPFTIAFCRLKMYQLPVLIRADEVIERLQQAIPTFQEAGEVFYEAVAYSCLGMAYYKAGRRKEVLNALRRGLALARQTGDTYITSDLLWSLGSMIWMEVGLTADSEKYYREALNLRREMGAWVPYAITLSQVASMPLWRYGDRFKDRALVDEALAVAKAQKVPHITAHVLTEMTAYLLVEERYQDALATTNEVLALTHSHGATAVLSRFQRGIAYLGLGDIEEAIESLTVSLARMVEEDWSGMLRVLLAFPGVILAELGETEKAVELLALGLTDPYTPGRLQADPLIARAGAELKETLGEEAFDLAWERGRQLDALEAAADVLQQLSAPD
jgi:DNA-binding SARP family transcriptional activator/predicted ATPase